MVAVLFARRDSIYKDLAGVEVFDAERDARTWPGGAPVVAHPPCRAWGRLRHFAKPREDEKALGLWAVDQVRQFGGVLEHPAFSSLWLARAMPGPRDGADLFGGWTLDVDQIWWGHQAVKRTWLYIVGVERSEVRVPLSLDAPSRYVAAKSGRRKGMQGWMPDMSTAEREKTPGALALWLVDLAGRARP